MTTELTLLAWAVVLGLVQAVGTGELVVMQHGFRYGLSPRDERKPLTGVSGRLQRAFGNYLETFPMFAAAVLIAHAAGRHDWMTVTGAHLYFWARLAFVPLYASGIPGPRSAAYGVSLVGIGLILFALL